MEEPVPKKCRVSSWKYDSRCICSDLRCAKAMASLAELDPDRHAYVRLPQEPKDLDSLKKKPRDKALVQRNKQSLNRKQILKAIGPAAVQRTNDEEYNSKAKFRIASVHFHKDIFQLFQRTTDGRVQLPMDIPATLAHSLTRRGFVFTNSDKHEDDGTYCPLPNYPVCKWEEDIKELERIASRVKALTPDRHNQARSTRNTLALPNVLEHEQTREQL